MTKVADDWRVACRDIGVAGIYDEFHSAGDAIRQLGHYIQQAHDAVGHRDGNALADEIRERLATRVPQCLDCDEPSKCAVMGCGWAAVVKYFGWTLEELSARGFPRPEGITFRPPREMG